MTRAALAALALVAGVACSRGPSLRVAVVDGGEVGVAWVEAVGVQARPGDSVVIRNANTGEASPWHAFVPASGEVPPLFVGRGGGGVAPNPAVWGECHGGDAREAVGTCPIATIEGPSSWDGTAYWSTGQILPGEERTIPLDPAIAHGTYRFACVFHPDLVVPIEVVSEPVELEPIVVDVAEAARVARARPTRANQVVAGVLLDHAEVLAFHPRVIQISAGESVTWRVAGPSPHTVELGAIEAVDLLDTVPPFTVPNASSGGWNGRDEVHSGFMSTDASAPGGATFTLRFNEPGVYEYVCRFHSSMAGRVRVRR